MAAGIVGASGRAYDYIYKGILSGKFPLSSPISEVEIGEALALSRSPVREALKRMEAEGLVCHYAGRGTFVTDITQRDLEEIFELRILFELHSLRTACSYFDDEILDRLEQGFLRLNDNSDPQEYYDVNHLLHTSIIAYGGNGRVQKFYNMLSAQIAIVNRISSRDPDHFQNSKKKHLNILYAIKRQDLERAEQYLSEHLQEVRERTIKAYAEPVPIRPAPSRKARKFADKAFRE